VGKALGLAAGARPVATALGTGMGVRAPDTPLGQGDAEAVVLGTGLADGDAARLREASAAA
jgi:hypothetical protein